MKARFDCQMPFSYAHGGGAIQILQTRAALIAAGVECGFLEWWNEDQPADIIHFFGRPAEFYTYHARLAGRRFVISELLTGQGSWKPLRRLPNRTLAAISRATGRRLGSRLGWGAYRLADAILALTPWEARLLVELYDAPAERIHVVPNGVEREFLDAPSVPAGAREDFLVCTATITERKRTVELAEAAHAAGIPLTIIGKPYSEADPYYLRFREVVAAARGSVRYAGPISSRAELAALYARARGFVLLSTMESLSLSALEAAACGCPLLLSDLPWARCTFGGKASYAPIAGTTETAGALRRFHASAPELPRPDRPLSWNDIGLQIRGIYQEILKG